VKVKQIGFGTLILLFFISSLFLFSCSTKKIKSEDLVSKPPTAKEEKKEAPKKQAVSKDQDLREKALKEEEARRQREAAERARFEAEDIHFDFDQYLLTDSAKQNLNRKAQWLKQFPAAKAVIEGNCDERGSAEYNLALGQKRADAAMEYLVSLGIKADRLTTISYGKEKPLDPRSNEEAWAKNRRDHFVLKIETKGLPPTALKNK
jgi:peptidoglycan-associated lipoprotein